MKKPTQTDAPPVLQMAVATAMTQPEIIASFKSKDQTGSRLFIELAKLLIAFRKKLGAKSSQATAILKKQGIRPGSVNSASEAARVYEELVPAHLDEGQFDTLAKSDITSINRCMSGASKTTLKAAEVADLLKRSPDDFGEELESIYATGHTIAEADAIAKKALADATQAEKDKAAKEAQDKLDAAAESARLDKENKELAETIAKLAANQAPPADVPPAEGTVTGEAQDATVAGGDTGAPTEPPAPVVPVAPTNVIDLPPQPPAEPDAELPGALAALDAILVSAHGFTKAGKEAIAIKLMEMNEALFPTVAAPAALPAKGKGKKAA